MNTEPSFDPLRQQLQFLLGSYGYRFYGTANQARTDDLLVRERASYYLGQSVELMSNLRIAYQRVAIPPLTRENPDPPVDAMTQLREMEHIQQSISDLEVHIRGMSIPTQDRVWKRFRREQSLLYQLLTFDLTLVRTCEQMHQYVSQITTLNWDYMVNGWLRQLITQITQVSRDRAQLLLLPI